MNNGNVPHKNTVRKFVENGYYHVYNRGVEKRVIFQDDLDYRVFLHLLKYYLSPAEENVGHPFKDHEIIKRVRLRPTETLSKEIDLLAYCLMPNHFHLLIKQITKDGLTKLMRRLSTTYATYFNKRYKRVGYLFQGRYKAVLVDSDEYIQHLSRYIHLNPVNSEFRIRFDLVDYRYSSYPYYLRNKRAVWVKSDFVLSHFNNPQSYKKFVEGESNSEEILSTLIIDQE